MQPPVTEPSSLLRQGTQLLAQRTIIAAARLVANDRPIRIYDPARPPLANIKQGLKL